MADYPPPLDQLLTLGEPRMGREWPNYLKLGLGPEQIPDLIRMATDPALNLADSKSKEVWAPLHAWRTLGQLHADAAVEPLLQLIKDDDEEYPDDWARGELPEVFALIGPPAIPTLAAYLADRSQGVYSRWVVLDGLKEIALEHPPTRDECVGIFSRQLEQAEQDDPTLNGVLVSALLDLGAVEAAPVLEKAFAVGAVDVTIAGDWEDVQYELGLREEPPSRYGPYEFAPPLPDYSDGFRQRPSRTAKEKAKARRKQAKKARKRNRKRH